MNKEKTLSQPLVSVIIPARNSAEYIATAIESIQKQTYRSIEILIIDDNSTDDTKVVVEAIAAKDPRIRYYMMTEDDPERIDPRTKRNINAGYAARNFAFAHARGEFITFQDADDASLLDRIEIQYELLVRHSATHVCTNWIPFERSLLNGTFGIKKALEQVSTVRTYTPQELYLHSQKTKGLIAKISPHLNAKIPFHIKRRRGLHRLFFGALDPYPGAAGISFFRREVLEKVRFRKLADRVWPSFMGRGADRDFNFQVTETFKNSYVFMLPLYMWRK